MNSQITQPEHEILRILLEGEAFSITDLSSESGISVPTVTKYMSRLAEKGLVENCGKVSIEHGRRPMLYKIKADSSFFVGVDIRPQAVIIGIMDISGRFIFNQETPLAFSSTPETLETICSRVEDAIAASGINLALVHRVSFNISGRVNPRTGFSYTMFNFENDDEPLSEILSQRLGICSIIENDTRAMAYGELRLAVKDTYKDFLFINAGWGLGMSIIIGGEPYYGMEGYSGELGHTNVFDNEKMCHCGKKGCLETEVSGKAICAKFQQRLKDGAVSLLHPDAHLTELDVIEAANREDTLSIELIEQAGSLLGKQIANLINIFNPEAVIIGGTLASAGDFFIQPIKLAVQRYTLKLMSKNMVIKASDLGEKAGVRGACLLARDDYFRTML
jgi:predicted NBD/HSP70 family sugar kinase